MTERNSHEMTSSAMYLGYFKLTAGGYPIDMRNMHTINMKLVVFMAQVLVVWKSTDWLFSLVFVLVTSRFSWRLTIYLKKDTGLKISRKL